LFRVKDAKETLEDNAFFEEVMGVMVQNCRLERHQLPATRTTLSETAAGRRLPGTTTAHNLHKKKTGKRTEIHLELYKETNYRRSCTFLMAQVANDVTVSDRTVINPIGWLTIPLPARPDIPPAPTTPQFQSALKVFVPVLDDHNCAGMV
jgi:hypothetical protein